VLSNRGYCKNCYGTGTHYLKNVPCRKCSVDNDKENEEIMPNMKDNKV
jgi:hypothetical protein